MLRHLTRLLARASTRTGTPSKNVAIVVPLSSRPQLTPDELVSLRHLEHYLGAYDKYMLAPAGAPFNRPGFEMVRYPTRFFGSAAAHNLLLYSPALYRQFSNYRYVFFYHLDSLVFSDQLAQWCGAGLDYIGPPWIESEDSPWITRPRVGNGGFTLLKVESALQVLRARFQKDPFTFWLDMFTRQRDRVAPVVNYLRRLQQRFPGTKIIERAIHEWDQMSNPGKHNRNNDIFWSDQAQYYLPSFKVASVEQGLQFAFEVSPRACLERTGGTLPFGCHAWARYDRAFWEPYLLKASESTRPLPCEQAAATA